MPPCFGASTVHPRPRRLCSRTLREEAVYEPSGEGLPHSQPHAASFYSNSTGSVETVRPTGDFRLRAPCSRPSALIHTAKANPSVVPNRCEHAETWYLPTTRKAGPAHALYHFLDLHYMSRSVLRRRKLATDCDLSPPRPPGGRSARPRPQKAHSTNGPMRASVSNRRLRLSSLIPTPHLIPWRTIAWWTSHWRTPVGLAPRLC